ncbi:MAG TPA: hypothetical protein DHU96_32255 [Actinobacteria bacterium]|nr:hypothetical protein [Actinomycetota bacterium]
MRGHVGTETIAAFREDLLSRREAARVAAHLAACPQCTEVDGQLAAVTAVLAAAPAPPLPASVAARLDAALAAEIARPAAPADSAVYAAPGGAAPSHAAPSHAAGEAAPGGTPGRRTSRRGRAARGGHAADQRGVPWLSLRLVAATAAVVLLGGGGYVVSRVLAGASAGVPASPASAAAPHGAMSRRSPAGLAPALGTASGALRFPVIASGTRYRPGQLRAQVAATLRRYPAPSGQPSHQFGSRQYSPASFPHLAACVSRITGGGQPRLIDIAHYGTRPAAVIVLPVTGSPMVRVWVVGTGCPAGGGDVIARLTMPGTG